jgi:hypothetical protein
MMLSWMYCVRLPQLLCGLFSARFGLVRIGVSSHQASTHGYRVEGSGNRWLSGLENGAGSLHPSGRRIVSSYSGVPSHQSDGYDPGDGYAENLHVGRTVGTKQGMGHFGLVLCARFTEKTNQ